MYSNYLIITRVQFTNNSFTLFLQEVKQDKENGVLIIRNSFPQLVDIDNLQAVHFGNIDQWLEVRE